MKRNRGSGSSGSGGGEKSSVTMGLTIAGIAFAVLFVLGIIIFFFSRKKRSNNSHLLEDEMLDKRKSFSMFSSRDLTKDMHSDYDGNSNSSSLFLVILNYSEIGYVVWFCCADLVSIKRVLVV